ncbi:autotransporter domain-containing protein [Lysobacter oculi]|uniref:Autotransporter domain-containing protein n=2 Tax=Solilutibacter oculi TaxID=2698682 RepID=A0A344J549_9GAMM|nr:autotransporter domain-containing protein [Lysobacter oculi]
MEPEMRCLSRRNALSIAVAGALTLGLTACGGGGGTKTTPPPATPPGGTGGIGFTPTVATDSTLSQNVAPAVAAPAAPRQFSSQQLSDHLRLINAAGSLGAGNTGQGVTIGILDSGVDRNHPGLSPRVVRNIMPPDNWTGFDRTVDDKVGHGTVVSLLAAGGEVTGQFSGGQSAQWPGGVAQSSNIVSWRFIRDERPVDDGTGQGGNEIKAGDGYGDFFKALNADLANAGARIINNSWGGLYWNDPALSRELATAYKDFIIGRGGIVVFASGNSGDSTNPELANNPSDNAALPSMHGGDAELEKGWLTVGALDPKNPTQLTGYSQKCGYAKNYCLVAPGDAVFPLKDANGVMRFYGGGGTSYAAPLVSGAAAVVWAAFPYMNNDQVRQVLLGTAKDLGAAGMDDVFGWGLLDVTKASWGPGNFAWGNFDVNVTSNSVWRNNIVGAGGLIKRGGGTLTLTEAQSYTGDTRVEAGALDIRQGLGASSLTVGSGGLVYGGGVFARNVSNSGRFFNGRDAGATLAGNYLQTASGNLGIWLGTPLQVNGTATLQGGQVSILGNRSGYTTTSKETLLKANGGLTGTFASVKAAPNVFLDATLGYDANSAFLTINRIQVNVAALSLGLTGVSLDSAQRVEALFGAIDGGLVPPNSILVGGAGDLQNGSLNAAIADRSLRSLAGQMHAANLALTLESMDAGRRAMTNRFDALVDRPLLAGAWQDNLRDNGNLAQAGANGMAYQLDGWMMGQDVRVGHDGVFGLAASHTEADGWMSGLGDRTRSRQTEAQAYAGWLGVQAYLRGGVGAGRFDREVERNVQLGLRQEGVNTLGGGSYLFANTEAGYRFDLGAATVSPYVGSQFAQVRTDGFNEAGASGFGLRADGWNFDRWQAYAGMRANRDWQLANGSSFGIDGRAEWQHGLSDGNALMASFTGIEQWMPVAGLSMAQRGTLFGLGFNAQWRNGSLLRLDVSQRGSELGDNRMVNASYRYRF